MGLRYGQRLMGRYPVEQVEACNGQQSLRQLIEV